MSGNPEANLEAQEPEGEEEFVLPDESTFAVTRWVRWFLAVFAPVLAAGFAWGAWEISQERLAGTGYDNVWRFAFILATLAILVFRNVYGLEYLMPRRRSTDQRGVVLRGVV